MFSGCFSKVTQSDLSLGPHRGPPGEGCAACAHCYNQGALAFGADSIPWTAGRERGRQPAPPGEGCVAAAQHYTQGALTKNGAGSIPSWAAGRERTGIVACAERRSSRTTRCKEQSHSNGHF
jgi:hypothetical protein